MTDALKQQYTLRISQANRSELTVILYEMLLSYIDDVKKAHTNKDRAAFREGIRKANGCVKELLASLDYSYEISYGLSNLYLYVSRELALVDVRNRPEGLEAVEMVIKGLCESFRKVSEQDKSDALMHNTQAVYAGLTYGKSDLNESLYSQGGSRGICV